MQTGSIEEVPAAGEKKACRGRSSGRAKPHRGVSPLWVRFCVSWQRNFSPCLGSRSQQAVLGIRGVVQLLDPDHEMSNIERRMSNDERPAQPEPRLGLIRNSSFMIRYSIFARGFVLFGSGYAGLGPERVGDEGEVGEW